MNDNILHFGVSFLLYIFMLFASMNKDTLKGYFSLWLVPIFMASIIAISIGICKELLDNEFSYGDLSYNIIGVVCALVITSPISIYYAYKNAEQ